MSIRPQRIAMPLLAALAAACAASPQPEEPAAEMGGGVVHQDGAIVVSGVALQDGAGSVLGTLEGKVPSMQVQRHVGRCPQINLRSHARVIGTIINPHVYVDGTRATDTCILESLRAQDVESVEVYPMGYTKRPGYGTHGQGLILVFMRSQ